MDLTGSSVLPFLVPIWLVWIILGLLLNALVDLKRLIPRPLTDIMEYGKTRSVGSTELLSVPKRWFTHFYVWGSVWILSTFLVYVNTCGPSLSLKQIPVLEHMAHVDVAVVLSMLSAQVLRRLYECLCVSVFSSDARIHLFHYALGMLYYPMVAFTALLHLHNIKHSDSASVSGVWAFVRWTHLAAVCLFLWASYHQHVCHKILAGLRTGGGASGRKGAGRGNSSDGYGRPDGDWFELVSCPHFLAEVLIYAAMLLCLVGSDPCTPWWLVVCHVLCSLTLSARQSHRWYRQKFDDYPPHRRAILPWVC